MHRRPRFERAPPEPETSLPALSELVEHEIEARGARTRVFGDRLFRDPVWDILIELARTSVRGDQVGLSALLQSAGVPHSTGARHVKLLVARGHARRARDPHDGRCCVVIPTVKGMGAVSRCLREMHRLRTRR